MGDPTGLYENCADNADWGYICYDSTQVGLPAEPPSNSDVAADWCQWDSGFEAPYEDPTPRVEPGTQGGVASRQASNCSTLC